jgi:hypothetical protein
MRKIILLLITTLMLSSFNTDNISDFDIVGKWKGVVESKESGFLIFDKEGYAYIEYQGLKLGGKEFVYKGEKGTLMYEVDYSKELIEIDLILKKIDKDETIRVFCIAKKISENKMNFKLGIDGKRPKDFKDNYSMIFTRIRE